ncbi:MULTISPECIES: TetR/AcrR family transcriptional regulator [Paenibacillus]|uniref:TetR/AcrR family transcriptional regulator n=1 Tax=Paenibacillus TaxID=44249 RepID=UPI001F1FCE80|nr:MULTISPECIES: TetR/AcrR family transcriptional regulator [Paenibacillus]
MKDSEELIQDKTRQPQQDRSIRTKEAIVQAASRLFSEKGYHGTNTKQIAAAAGVSTGSFYSYFVDKRAVFIEVLRINSKAIHAHVDETIEKFNLHLADKREIISGLIDALVKSHAPYITFHRELSAMMVTDEEVQEIMEDQFDQARRKTLEVLKLSEPELRVRDLEAAAAVMFEAVNSAVDRMVFFRGGIEPDRIKAELTDMLLIYAFGE